MNRRARISEYDVIVVGGGMVGATLACALGGAGLRACVVEAQAPAEPAPDGDYDLRVAAVSPGSERVLRGLGVWPQIERRRVSAFREMHVWDAGGRGEIHFDCAEVGEPRLGHIVENRIVQAALVERLRQMDGVDWRCPETLASLTVADDDAEVTLSSGARLTSRLVVGADGPESEVRTQAGIVFNLQRYEQTAVVATVGTREPHRHTAWQRFLPSGPLAFLPLADGRCSIVWSTGEAHAQALEAMPEAEFRQELAEAFGHRLGPIDTTSTRATFPLRGGQAAAYVAPRVALVGDAAHVIHPLAGQGANLGFMDAASLAGVLGEAHHDVGSLRVLRRYERARKADNVVSMRVMEGFKYLFGNTLPPVSWLRNFGLNLTDAATPLKHAIMRHAMDLAGERPRLARGGE